MASARVALFQIGLNVLRSEPDESPDLEETRAAFTATDPLVNSGNRDSVVTRDFTLVPEPWLIVFGGLESLLLAHTRIFTWRLW